MVAAPMAIQLRIKGFTKQVSISTSAPCTHMLSKSGSRCNCTCYALGFHCLEACTGER